MMKIFLLIFFLLCSNVIAAQKYAYKLFTKKDGLSNDHINCLAKDKNGFLWVGTNNGLNRFDGSAFDNFYNNPADSTSIQSNEIQDVLITKNNQLWVSTLNGISKFDRLSQRFENYAPDTAVLPKIGYGFSKLYQSSNGDIWVGTWYDLLIFNESSKTFKSSGWGNFAKGLNIKNANNTRVLVMGIAAKSADELWILSTYGLFSMHLKTSRFTFYENNYINDFYGSTIGYVDERNNVYINTYNKGLVYYSSSHKSWYHFDAPVQKPLQHTVVNNVYGIKKLNGDTLIYCSNNVLYLFDAASNKTIRALSVETGTVEKNSFTWYLGTLIDNHTLWVQTNKGLAQLKPFSPKFEEQTVDKVQYLGRCFTTGKPHEFIVSDADRAVFYYNKVTKQKNYITTLGNQLIQEELSYYLKLNNDTAYCTTENGFYLLLNNKAIPIPLPKKPIERNPYTVRNIVQDGKMNLYIRCRKQGVVQYNMQNKTATFLSYIPANENNEYAALFFDSATNNLWIALQNKGVYVCNTRTGNIQHFLLDIAPSQRGGSIYCITKSKGGVIFLADMYNGLFGYYNNSGLFVRYTSKDGLPTNNCFWLSTYNDRMWVGNAGGLSLMDINTGLFKNYKIPDGNSYLADYFLTDSLGNSYTASGNKMLSWNISNFIALPEKGSMYLRQCKLFDQVLPEKTHYDFTYVENNIHFTIGYLLLNNENEVMFEYKLNDAGWISMGADNKVSFSNLSPNKYVLQVRLRNDTEATLQIRFNIAPPFYKTWWFVLVVVASIAALLYAVFKSRINTVRQQANLKQKMAETEMMALKAQMNPHFIFNCISSIDNFILDNDAANASAYLNKFAKLIRNILDNSINDLVPFWKDWETLSYYIDLEKLRNNDRFTCIISADDALVNGHYKIPPLIIQPYVENAIQHGLKPLQQKQGLLEIRATLQNGLLVYTIKDNGVGRNTSVNTASIKASHTSYGMALTEQRINLFNAQHKHAVAIADLKDEEGNNAGTLITITLSV